MVGRGHAVVNHNQNFNAALLTFFKDILCPHPRSEVHGIFID